MVVTVCPEPLVPTLRKFNMTFDDWLALKQYQGGKCHLCRKTFTKKRRPVIDHEHRTGYVRGLLCSPCNQALGVLHEDGAWLMRAARYLRKPPAMFALTDRPRHVDAPPLPEET